MLLETSAACKPPYPFFSFPRMRYDGATHVAPYGFHATKISLATERLKLDIPLPRNFGFLLRNIPGGRSVLILMRS